MEAFKLQPTGTIIIMDQEQLVMAMNRLYDKAKEDALVQFRAAESNVSHQELLTRNEVKLLLNKSANTLWKWSKKGYLVPVRVGGSLMYKASDVKRIMGGK